MLRLNDLEKKIASMEQAREVAEQERDRAAQDRDRAARERDEYHRLYLEMMEKNRELERGIMTSKSEHLPPSDSQLALSVLSMMLGDRERAAIESAVKQAETVMVPEYTRSKPTGRKPIPDHLPRVE